jgi:hypothetical protein
VLIIVDGLDALKLDEHNVLLEAVTTLIKKLRGMVKILISSREKPSLFGDGCEPLELQIEPKFIKPDIDAFIQDARSRFWRINSRIPNEVSKVVNQTINEGWKT